LAAVRKHLKLQLYDEETIPEDKSFVYEPFDVFRELSDLEVLAIPFMLLMRLTSDGARASYPQGRDVLPPNLITLKLDMHPWTSSIANAETILRCMPADTDSTFDSSLSSVKLLYGGHSLDGWYTTLPMNFWQVRNQLLLRGISCDYMILNAI
jgi:hypothetical protein